MASTSQSLRYIGPPAPGAGGGSLDALNRILADLCTHGNPKVYDLFCLFSQKITENVEFWSLLVAVLLLEVCRGSLKSQFS